MFAILSLILAWFILLYVGRSPNLYFIIKVVLVWLMLTYIGMNLIGYMVRNLASWFSPPDDISEDASEIFICEMRSIRRAQKQLGLIFFVLTVAYLVAIYHYWNVTLVASAILVMIGRLPTLLLEIRTGRRRIPNGNVSEGVLYIVCVAIVILTLPLIWHSLCEWMP